MTSTENPVSEIEAAEALWAAGRHRDSIDHLTEANRRHPDPAIEQRLVELRHDAFYAITHEGPEEWPPIVDDQFPGVVGVPEIDGADLTATALISGVQHHGALLVRGLVTPDVAVDLAKGIDRAFDAAQNKPDDAVESDPAPWYVPFEPEGVEAMAPGKSGRLFVRSGGGVWTADSPRMLASILDSLSEAGFVDVVNDYLGEAAAISVKKSTLRIVPHDTNTNWHQDGAFLGDGIRSLNLWLALSDCGVDSPSLDVVPHRFDDLFETGTRGAAFDWSAGHDLVMERAGESGFLRPVFEPGDALLFDHLFMHRTGVAEGMTRPRHAIESWFFASSCYPTGQVPLLI